MIQLRSTTVFTTARSIAYWVLWFWLLFGLWMFVTDIMMYREDPETYHQVYRYPDLEQLTSWIFAVLSGAGIVMQVFGWRTRRFSPAALAALGLFACFQAADAFFGLNPICCG